METLPRSPVLKFPPDTLEVVRKSLGIDGAERMKQSIDILDEWIKQQAHFIKKNFSEWFRFVLPSHRVFIYFSLSVCRYRMSHTAPFIYTVSNLPR